MKVQPRNIGTQPQVVNWSSVHGARDGGKRFQHGALKLHTYVYCAKPAYLQMKQSPYHKVDLYVFVS